MKVEVDPFTKKRVKDSLTDQDPKKMFIELAEEFGRRLSKAVTQGLDYPTAFEACRQHYRVIGQAMIDVANAVSLETCPEPIKELEK